MFFFSFGAEKREEKRLTTHIIWVKRTEERRWQKIFSNLYMLYIHMNEGIWGFADVL